MKPIKNDPLNRCCATVALLAHTLLVVAVCQPGHEALIEAVHIGGYVLLLATSAAEVAREFLAK